MITKRPWFGPKSLGLGWGWEPVAWQGWAAFAVFLIAMIGANVMVPASGLRVIALVACVAVFLVVVILTGTKLGRRSPP